MIDHRINTLEMDIYCKLENCAVNLYLESEAAMRKGDIANSVDLCISWPNAKLSEHVHE